MKRFLPLRLVVFENPHHLLINVRRRSLNLAFLSSTMDRSAAMKVLLRVFSNQKILADHRDLYQHSARCRFLMQIKGTTRLTYRHPLKTSSIYIGIFLLWNKEIYDVLAHIAALFFVLHLSPSNCCQKHYQYSNHSSRIPLKILDSQEALLVEAISGQIWFFSLSCRW